MHGDTELEAHNHPRMARRRKQDNEIMISRNSGVWNWEVQEICLVRRKEPNIVHMLDYELYARFQSESGQTRSPGKTNIDRYNNQQEG